MFALGATTTDKDNAEDLEIGAKITEACRSTYNSTKSGVGPESFTFNEQGETHPAVNFYVLRPETVESYFYLWRVTKEQKFRDWAWEAFLALNTSCRGEFGFYGLNDVNNPSNPRDPQESFFMSETLKYLYLSFTSDDVISLDEWVFNTEAHPIHVYDQPESQWFSLFSEFENKK